MVQAHPHGHPKGPAHAHAHAHSHGGRSASRSRLAATLALVLVYMVAEVVGGYLTNSLALLADAGHMVSDAAALGLSLFALWLADRPPTRQRSFGFYRAEILAALANGAALIAISAFILVEAWDRFREPPAVQGGAMMLVATGGLLVNLAGLWLLKSGRDGGLNERGAWLHVLTDALGSVGAIIGGLCIWKFGWAWADPAVSVLIGVLVMFSSWRLLQETVSVLMESTPSHIDVDALRRMMLDVTGVQNVHDLHVWSITSGQESMSAHVCVDDAVNGDDMLRALRKCAHDTFGIEHTTFQLESPGFTEAATHD
jgi:cobalt-zinc-cadmium efflux system protein